MTRRLILVLALVPVLALALPVRRLRLMIAVAASGVSVDPLWVGLLGYYALDETSGTNVADQIGGNATPGYATNGRIFTSEVAGKKNTAADFTQGNDGIWFPNSTNLNPSSQITISAWVNFNSRGFQNIVGRDIVTAGSRCYALYVTSGPNIRLFFYDSANAGVDVRWSYTGWTTGTWYHVVGVYDQTNAMLYVDNTVRRSVAWDGKTLKQADIPTDIGFRKGPTPDLYADSYIDEVAIWNRALSPVEIGMLYSNSYYRTK